jgi:crotonobetainyl-CoA:carnitine CoA-transferase CaiB-like acyl-CoA transferase
VDRWCAIAVRDDAEWRALASLAGLTSGLEAGPDAGLGAERYAGLGAERYATAAGRRAASAALDADLSAWTRLQPAAWLAARLQAHGVPAAPVQDGRDLVEQDAHLRERGFYVPARHATVGQFPHEGVPVRLSATPGAVRTAAPVLGADTVAVLRDDLGLSDADLAELATAGVLS